MAVEARHMHLLPSQLLSNRLDFCGDFIKPNQGNGYLYNTPMYSGMPLAGAMPETHPPFNQSVDCNLASAKTFMTQADSGLTYNIPDQRKRPTDTINELNSFIVPQKRTKLSGLPSFLPPEIILQEQQQQSEIDLFLAQYADKVKSKLEEQRRMLASAFQENFAKKLMEKDGEIQRIGKLNWVLQERVQSLWLENQIWRDLAQTNEATANNLRSNLEQVLAQISSKDSDAESSCGSNYLADEGGHTEVDAAPKEKTEGCSRNRMCRQCGVSESKVLLLPCRHLCLCTTCGSCLRNCPVCHSVINASVHVNFS